MNDTVTLGHFGCEYNVNLTGDHPLPPVRITIRQGVVNLQDYLTPADAVLLADMLLETASRVKP